MSVSAPVPYTYQSAPLTTDATAIKGQITDYVAAYMPPGFKIPQGSMIDLICEAVAIQAAQQADVAQTKLDSDFRYFGSLFGVPPVDAVSSQATCTFTVKDNAGYTINPGDVVGIVDATGVLRGFTLSAPVVIAPTLTTGTGTVVAEDAGTLTNGLSGTAQLVQVEPYVTGAVLSAASNGIDAELDATYLNRLVETASVFRLIPVLGADFAVLARSIAGIYRATGVNQLKPGSPYDITGENDNIDKNVTVAVADINGATVGSTIRNNAQTYLRSLREDNFEIWVVDPQYDEIDVTVTIYSWPTWDPTAVQTAAEAAIAAVLSPATAQTDPSGNAARWASDPVVYASSLYQAIMSSSGGVRNANAPSFGIHGGSMGTTDVALGAGSDIPALPTPGTIAVTVVPTT